MHIDGDLKGSSVGYKKLEIDFSKEENSELSVVDSLNFQPAKKIKMMNDREDVKQCGQ